VIVDRELLLEIGCEELPASWLPGLTHQIGEVVVAELTKARLVPETPAETFSTPRRLALRIARVPERQTDLEELVNGPPVSAAFRPDGTPTPAATGFAAKQGVEIAGLERLRTPKGEYLAYRRRQRGKTSVDVLPDVLGSALRALTFPKLMHWDAIIEDGRGEFLFGRPIRWILYLYGGRVVPFTIAWSAIRVRARRDERRGDVRPPLFGHQRPCRPCDQGALVRRVPQSSPREFRRARAERTARQNREPARRQGPATARPGQSHRA
jgi:glycyl-tRNA synthetase beta chain